MHRPLTIVLLLALAGCSALPRGQVAASPCDVSQVSYECQVERYEHVGVQ
jgi:hypothetical protein